MVRIGNFLFKYRDVVFPVVLLGLVFATRPVLAGGDVRRDHWLDLVGIAIAMAGQALRILVIGFVYVIRGGRNKQIYAETLVDGGLFAHCRNPLYVGNILIVLGLIVVHNSVWLYLVALLFFVLAYLAIVLAEETFLRTKFGAAYDAYCARVPRFVPSVAGLGRTLSGLHFDWERVIRKEYGTPFAWMSGILALMIWEHAANPGQPIGARELTLIEIVWAVLVVAYLIARVLKKSGRLGDG